MRNANCVVNAIPRTTELPITNDMGSDPRIPVDRKDVAFRRLVMVTVDTTAETVTNVAMIPNHKRLCASKGSLLLT